MKRHVLHYTEGFDFEAGGHLDTMDIAYYTSEKEYTPGDKVIWICHALTGNADPVEWWPQMCGPGCLYDSQKYFLVSVAMICSAYSDCGPRTINPATGKPYLLSFPETTVRDMVKSAIIVRKHLGIEKIDMMLGPSIGGFLTTEWLVTEPDVIRNAVILATADRATPYLVAFNESQRMAMLADPTFLEQKDIHGGEKGLECARSIALISYRTFEGYHASQQDPDVDTLFAERAASYQRYQGKKLVSRQFDAYSYWYLSRALDSMNVGRGRGGVEKALGSIKAKCTVICITSDQLFPAAQLKRISESIPGATYHEIYSIYGHDGFLIENDVLVSILEKIEL